MNWGVILGRNWDKSFKSFPPCYSQSPLLLRPPSWAKVVWNWFVSKFYTETSSLRPLKIMPRNLNKIVRSWIRLPVYLCCLLRCLLQNVQYVSCSIYMYVITLCTRSVGIYQMHSQIRLLIALLIFRVSSSAISCIVVCLLNKRLSAWMHDCMSASLP